MSQRGSRQTIAERMSDALCTDHGQMILPIADCKTLIRYFVNEVTNELCEKGSVEIRGLGVFTIKKIKSRKVRNPKNNKIYISPESWRVFIKPSILLKRAVQQAKPVKTTK